MPNYTQIACRVTIEEKDTLLEYCKANDISLSQLIRKALREFLPQED